ncbi:MAG: MFS transporter [Gaiella sp.]
MSRRLLFALLAMGVAQAAVYLIRPTTSYRLLAYGEGAQAVGLVAAAFALLPIFLAIPLGRISDRRGAPLLAIGCAVQTVGCLALAFSATTLTIAATSAVIGLGHLALALGAQDVVARESRSDRHDHHFGLLTAGVSLGQLFGPLLAGLLLGERGTPSAGATTRCLLVATGILVLATLCAAVAEASRGTPSVRTASRRGSVRTIVRTRGVPAGIFASIAVLAASDVFTAYMPVIGAENHIGPRTIGVLLALRAAASIAARVGIGATVRRIGRTRLITMGATAAAVALAAMTATHEVWVLAALSIVAGFGMGFGQPLSMTLVVRLVPEHAKSTALAVRLTGNRIGQVATPAAAGVVAGNAGTSSVFWLLGAILAVSALVIQQPALDRPEEVDGVESAIE